MRAAFALRIFSGKMILICNSGKSADFPELRFHRKSLYGETGRTSGSPTFNDVPLPQQLLPVLPLLSPAVTSSPGAGEVFARWRRSSLLLGIFSGILILFCVCHIAFGLVNPCYQYFRFYNSSVLYYNEVIAFIPSIYRRNLPCW